MRRLAAAMTLLVLIPAAPAPADVVVEQISFSVTNPLDPGIPYTVNAELFRPSTEPRCATSVLLLVHGLSYGIFGWDFPIEPEKYSVARALAERGYPSVAIDLPGYGPSTHPNGYLLTVEGYASMVSQMAAALRSGAYASAAPRTSFGHVALMGHSAGTEISELEAALYADVDALIATGYTHFPSQRIITDFATGDNVRAAQSDYEYFGENERQRSEYMYNLAVADPAIVAKDNSLARLTPSGEVFSIDGQPSGKVQGKISVPTLLVLGEKDILFLVENGEQELALFAGAADKTLMVVKDAGHSFMLHPNAAETNAKIADWLDARSSAVPHC